MSHEEGERSSQEIRRDIEHTRAEMDETVDALESRLSPGQLLDQLWSSVKRGGGSGIGDAVRDHPVPLALMGLGVAWLAAEKTGNSHGGQVAPGTTAPAAGRRGPYRGDAVNHRDSEWDHAGTASRLEDRARDTASSVSQAARGVKEAVKSGAQDAAGSGKDVKDRAGQTLDDMRHGASHRAAQARGVFDRVMHEQPLALGAVSFGIGLAAGLAAPTTEWEDRTMGSTADALKHEVKETAQETGEKAVRVARDAAAAATEEVDPEEIGSNVADSARRMAAAAREAASDRAAREDLDADGLAKLGRDAAGRTRDAAREDMS